ncbi:darobactin export ABC transporter ATP-binding protein [Yersinia enterocolitica]|uniref:darobactin export ABC transporter ATP-binding protein n=1 Tax=Yersinia enterocolitica TaxID=630 RepID=UPI000D8C7F18|nr:darobactin export ABC transporter ATP-binding protein [Yersinia enterocolitica]SQA39497.1 ABC transporter ATP-binding protein [Yersinia enterocolitica]SUP66380.1 ABC transporter ATP-binding protein [Yersinia enterocolitica]SUQ39321.1 ABC transporter ATP-binding protein [Yersinia enterocolitica]HDM8272317.1 darobactin export ABC transporter ATP-binding protein [Yersinia enterocolitica]HED5566220.1 darobactin export ABC transporter ATP-binding protein [Yersinia enterocolitica]
MLNLQNAEKCYTTKTVRTKVFNQLNFSVEKGDFVSIMGPSGSGKSTLLNIIGMFDSLDSGSLILAGENVCSLSYSQRITLRRELIGYIFQSFNLISHLSIFDNVALPLKYRGVAQKERLIRVNQILNLFSIENRRDHQPMQLSGGQQQRVAIARAMISEPALLLADEPTGNLDSKNARAVLEQLQKINQTGTTIIMVTHSDEASKYGNRVIKMKDGKLT